MNSIDMGTFSEDLFLIFRDSLSDFLNEKGLVKLRKLLQYIYIKGGVSVEQVTRAISHESPKLKEEAMATILEMLKQEFIDGEQRGRRKGIEEGIEQGLLRGVQELLIKQLERRFGILTENEREVKCNCKNQDRLEVASIVLLESKTKEEVIDKLK
ncbi:MAG: hypothetical protein H3C43_12460 [Leptonema sp. (in: Bacteria)]|nr:hypothetical protein [Leptonema sp. (in: bacteria)]